MLGHSRAPLARFFARPVVACVVVATALAARDAVAKEPPADEPSPNPPQISLTIEPSSNAAAPWSWTMRVVNRDTTPLRLVADARLLRFEIQPPEPKPAPDADTDANKSDKPAKG